jgi:hypothetical protein
MSHISGVDFPATINFGVPFNVTVHYETDVGATRVDVTVLSHLDVSPSTIDVDPTATAKTASLKITAPPGGGAQIILVRFTLGASEWTSGASAS